MKNKHLKKLGKIVISAFILPTALCISFIPISAQNNNELIITNESIPEELIYENAEGVYTFESVEDKNAFIESQSGISTYSDVQTTSSLISSKRYANAWINFLTDAWSYHTSFNYSASQTYSATLTGSYKGIGFSVTATKTYSIGGTIAADSSRLSRLGMWQTYTVSKYHAVTTGGYGSYIIREFDYNHTSKEGAPIVNACYKTNPHKYGEPWS